MKIEKTLRYLAERFITQNQVNRLNVTLETLVTNKMISKRQETHIKESIKISEYNLEWNIEHIPEIWSYFYEHAKDDDEEENEGDKPSKNTMPQYLIIILATLGALIGALLLIFLILWLCKPNCCEEEEPEDDIKVEVFHY